MIHKNRLGCYCSPCWNVGHGRVITSHRKKIIAITCLCPKSIWNLLAKVSSDNICKILEIKSAWFHLCGKFVSVETILEGHTEFPKDNSSFWCYTICMTGVWINIITTDERVTKHLPPVVGAKRPKFVRDVVSWQMKSQSDTAVTCEVL